MNINGKHTGLMITYNHAWPPLVCHGLASYLLDRVNEGRGFIHMSQYYSCQLEYGVQCIWCSSHWTNVCRQGMPWTLTATLQLLSLAHKYSSSYKISQTLIYNLDTVVRWLEAETSTIEGLNTFQSNWVTPSCMHIYKFVAICRATKYSIIYICVTFCIAGNFRRRKLSQIGRKGAFRGENFRGIWTDCIDGCGILKIWWRKLLQVAVKLRNLWRFSPSKVSRYMLPSQRACRTIILWLWHLLFSNPGYAIGSCSLNP